MLAFRTEQYSVHGEPVEIACLVDPDADTSDNAINVNGQTHQFERWVVQTIGLIARLTRHYLRHGYYVDCSIFGTLIMNGRYRPITERQQQADGVASHATFTERSEEQMLGNAAMMQLVLFGHRADDGKFYPRHTAVQLPGAQDLFLEKVGKTPYIAVASSAEVMALYGCNAIADVEELNGLVGSERFMHYAAPTNDELAAST